MTSPLDQALVDLIDQRIYAAAVTDTAVGSIADVDAALLRATAVLDGSTVAVPVKVAGNLNPVAGDRVLLQRFGSDWVVTDVFAHRALRTVAYPAASTAGSGTTTSASFVVISGLPTLTLTKRWSNPTGILVSVGAASYSTGVPNEAEFGVKLTGPAGAADTLVCGANHQTANVHFACHGIVLTASGLGAGSYTAEIVVRRSAGSSTVTINSDDYFTMSLTEEFV